MGGKKGRRKRGPTFSAAEECHPRFSAFLGDRISTRKKIGREATAETTWKKKKLARTAHRHRGERVFTRRRQQQERETGEHEATEQEGKRTARTYAKGKKKKKRGFQVLFTKGGKNVATAI